MLLKCLGAFIATASFSVVINAPKKYIPYAGITGALGWGIYLSILSQTQNKVLANFIATLLVAVTAHMMARIFKAPVTIFLIPGVIPLVPGFGMYRIVSSTIYATWNEASYYLFETLQMAGAIALGIFVVDTIFRKSLRAFSERKK